MRDAYTLFDQIVSFSGGQISSLLIKEKLGLVGLEELNALTDTCVNNNTAGALEKIDRALESGIAIEQFVIDLAGYFRGLLLIKAGITKESLLGYGVERFSKAWEKLSLEQLEQGLSILLDLYRDIRYSLSPRFELETAVSKLCWLNKWVSPVELRAAVEGARVALGGHTMGQTLKPPVEPPYGQPAAIPSAIAPDNDRQNADGDAAGDKSGTLAEGFKQFLAQRTQAELKGGQKTEPAASEDAETVRRVFRGTYVNQGERE